MSERTCITFMKKNPYLTYPAVFSKFDFLNGPNFKSRSDCIFLKPKKITIDVKVGTMSVAFGPSKGKKAISKLHNSTHQ